MQESHLELYEYRTEADLPVNIEQKQICLKKLTKVTNYK